jgi:hypothetical protein
LRRHWNGQGQRTAGLLRLRSAEVQLLQTRRKWRPPLLRHACRDHRVPDRLHRCRALLHPGGAAVHLRSGVLRRRTVRPRRKRHVAMQRDHTDRPDLRRVGRRLHLTKRLLPGPDMQHRRRRGARHLWSGPASSSPTARSASAPLDVRDVGPDVRDVGSMLLRAVPRREWNPLRCRPKMHLPDHHSVTRSGRRRRFSRRRLGPATP